MKSIKWATALLVGALSASISLSAQPLSRVSKLTISTRHPAFDGKSFGSVGKYEILIGKVQALADPKSPQNAGIVDIDNAGRNRDGLIEYSFDVQIL